MTGEERNPSDGGTAEGPFERLFFEDKFRPVGRLTRAGK
jgi:hypothetical protein